MALPRRLQGCSHLFSFLSLLASSRNTVHSRFIKPGFHQRNRYLSNSISFQELGGQNARRSYKSLQLRPEDKAYIEKHFDNSKPRRLRTEDDFLNALRNHGYVPAVDRVDEMLDMNRSPFQSRDEFDKLTLGLLLRSAKSANGEIRNPYKIPNYSAGQNPVRTRTGHFPNFMPPHMFFLFPDDTNWAVLSKYFPLQEPPRPWHPITMVGLKQDYTREEVARRLEWSQVQNAKKLRNGYAWRAPDPETYKHFAELPPPPPPVIRECNTCKKPRYLMRFWNFYHQRWQHVAAAHRPFDCPTHKKGGGGRIMYAPKGTKVGGVKANGVEDKEWIEEETAVKLLFRSGFITLPTINQLIGEILAKAAINAGDPWRWIQPGDAIRWAMRGGRMNGLVDFSKINRTDQIETARKEQQEKFLEDHKMLLQEVRQMLKANPITADDLAKIPPGQFYPLGHPAVDAWRQFEYSRIRTTVKAQESREQKQQAHARMLKSKLRQAGEILEEMKLTKAEILMLERGQGEAWADPAFASLPTRDRADKIQSMEDADRIIIAKKAARTGLESDESTAPYKVWDHMERLDELRDRGRFPEISSQAPAPSRWLEKAAVRRESVISDRKDSSSISEPLGAESLVEEAIRAPELAAGTSEVSSLITENSHSSVSDREPSATSSTTTRPPDPPARMSHFSTYPQANISSDTARKRMRIDPDLRAKPSPFRRRGGDEEILYGERFRDSLYLESRDLDVRKEEDKARLLYIKSRLEGPERRAVQREENAFSLREGFLWQNARAKFANEGETTPKETLGNHSSKSENLGSKNVTVPASPQDKVES